MGGKSPAIVSASVPLETAAERIAFGKTLNAGQTCVAPDYVLVPRANAFADAYGTAVRMYPRIADNPDYSAIINPGNWHALSTCCRTRAAKVRR